MIHEIAPHKLNTEFRVVKAKDSDIVTFFHDRQVLLVNREGELRLPIVADFVDSTRLIRNVEYLFAIDNQGIFLYLGDRKELDININDHKFQWNEIDVFRSFSLQYEAFAGVTASQLYRWRRDNTYCGRCQTKLLTSKTERGLCCPDCHTTIYPKISPAVIVAITDGRRLLMTKYAHSVYKYYALVAGYVEIGESFEEAVQREVMEEVGLKVKNIQYYKSSPWAFSDSIMIGFFAELDGDDTVTLQESELSEATWFDYDQIPENPSKLSISQELVECIRKRKRKERNVEKNSTN